MPKAPQSRPWQRIAVVVALIGALYGVMAGIGHLSPELGLDLRGGTSVVLTPINKTGVTTGALDQAVSIIDQRVNGLGVNGSTVQRQGRNIIVEVPGKGRNSVLKLVGQTAALDFRQVCTAAAPAAATSKSAGKTKSSTSPSAYVVRTGKAKGSKGSGRTTSSKKTSSKTTTTSPCAAVGSAKALVPPASVLARFDSLTCTKSTLRPTDYIDQPKQWEAACQDPASGSPERYLLEPAAFTGKGLSGASATILQGNNGLITGQWIVQLSFKSSIQSTVEDVTSRLQNTSVPLAIVLDGVVESAPVINSAFSASAQIQGSSSNPFTETEADDLANVLKYGALPLSFTDSQAQSISASLGRSSLDDGLLAGGIGLALVVIYCFIYYRALGILTVVSLSVSGLLVYALVSLAGPAIGETLDLAGVAGLIVSIGITADSFVVFYERLKDEVREGRSVRSSVDRGWKRARRTILSADTVSLLAALILYAVSIGDVRGFAFTLGLSTLLDLFVVFMFTKPLVALAVRLPLFSTSRLSGLSPGHAGIPRASRPSAPPREA